MNKPARKRDPYKKWLSIIEIDKLVKDHANSPIFIVNRKGEKLLEVWLKELRFNQAFQVAEEILGVPIDQRQFQDSWARTELPKRTVSKPPNTATFGGYRLRGRSSLNRDKKQKPRPKKK